MEAHVEMFKRIIASELFRIKHLLEDMLHYSQHYSQLHWASFPKSHLQAKMDESMGLQ